MLKKTLLAAALLGSALALAACDDAQVATENLKKAADNFEVNRRITFINGFTNDVMIVIEGRCSQEHTNGKLAVICKTGPSEFKRHILGLSDNATYISEQMDPVSASVYRYRVTIKPSVVVPDFNFRN